MGARGFLELNESEAHIWSASLLEDKNNINYFYSILSEDEHERASSFRFFTDQRQFIMTRGILRCLLSLYLGQTPESIEIIYGLWGKPHLSEDKSLYFNLSHSRDYALYAVTRHYEIGVDLEYIDKSFELEEMAPHIFSAAELIYWKNLDLDERVNAFFTQWVLKEAFLKYTGKGWFSDKIVPYNVKQTSGNKNLHDEEANLYCFECVPGYASALFVESDASQLLHYTWDQSNFAPDETNKFGVVKKLLRAEIVKQTEGPLKFEAKCFPI